MRIAVGLLSLAAALAAGCSCNGSGGASDAAPARSLDPVWQVRGSAGVLEGMVTGKGGVVVIGEPEMSLYGPDGSVLASAPLPSTKPSGTYVLFTAAQPTIEGAFDMLVDTHDSPDAFLSEHGADLAQDFMTDTTLPDGYVLVTVGSRAFVLSQDGNGAIRLADIEKGSLGSVRSVAVPEGQAFGNPVHATLVASDGALLFAGNGSDGAASGVAVLRVNPADATATVLAVKLQGNEVRPMAMLKSGNQIIVVAADYDDGSSVRTYFTALALNDLGTKVVRQPVRIEENDFHAKIRDFTLVGTRVVAIQSTGCGYQLLSFDVNTFQPYPNLCVPYPDGYTASAYQGYMDLSDGVLYAAMSVENGVSGYTTLARLPPLDPP